MIHHLEGKPGSDVRRMVLLTILPSQLVLPDDCRYIAMCFLAVKSLIH